MAGLVKMAARLAAVAVPVAAGALTIAYSDTLKQQPAGKERSPQPVPVRVITMQPLELLPRVVGYGTVEPARDWRAVARVDGEVVETSELLANGEIASAGTQLLRIDDTDLRLSLAQVDAQLAALDVKDETLSSSLEISRSDLELSRNELKRQQDLSTQGVATQAALDQIRRQELAARAKVVEIENQLSLNAAEREILKAQRATLARSLDFTSVKAPYDVRIGSVEAELGQVVSRGQTLFTAEGVDVAEIAAQFSIGRIGPLVRTLGDGGTVLDLDAKVRLPAPGHSVSWDATVARVGEAIDARTQSASVVVRVDDPLGQAEAGRRPPLRRNMFVEVELSAPARKALVAPVDAVRDGEARVAAGDGTLETRQVQVDFTVDSAAIVTGGLAPGDRLVVTDPAVAVPGMAVKPVEDEALGKELAKIAAGTEPDK
ncbi:MAG: efflux RND transporter periplasmic adaptor subunit [Oricola sp.]